MVREKRVIFETIMLGMGAFALYKGAKAYKKSRRNKKRRRGESFEEGMESYDDCMLCQIGYAGINPRMLEYAINGLPYPFSLWANGRPQ